MARVFLTKVWGFSPEDYPALGFSSEAGRLKFLRESKPGDWVVLAGTKTTPTMPEHRGRLLGKVQLGREEVDVEEVLRSIGTQTGPEDYQDGKYRWPYGLPMIAAERFLDMPDLSEIFGDYLSGTHWAAYALDIEERLGAEAQARVAALRTEPVAIAEAPVIVRQREKRNAFLLSGGNTGPGPSPTRSGSEREPGAASVYLMELQGGDRFAQRKVFKIGYTADVQERLAELNKGLISKVTGYSWSMQMAQPFPTAKQAFSFEQSLHAQLRPHLVEGEKEIYMVARKDIDNVWTNLFARAEWATR